MKRIVYDFAEHLDRSNALVHLMKIDDFYEFSSLKKGIMESSIKYNFSFEEISLAYLDQPDKLNHKVKLLIVVSKDELNLDLVEKLIQLLSNGYYTCISFAFSFSSFQHMISYADIIESIKKRTNDQINFLRPDIFTDQGCFVSAQKIIDNSICDSVRVKYYPTCIDDSPLECPDYVLNFLQKSSEIYREYKLFHRSASDGFFAIRDKDNSAHFYVTATKTYKDHIDLKRVSKVLSYDPLSNELLYTGAFLPSSDSIEAYCVFSNAPHINTIVHTHASDKFTRNEDFRHKIKVPIAPYGEYCTGLLVDKALKEEDDGFIIMEEHGEVFTNTVFDVSPILLKLINFQYA